MTHDIFISYSRRDLAAVKPIKEELESLGFSCWMDLQGIESGSAEFTDHLVSAIDASICLLFFLSDSSQKSEWSLKEIRFAKRKRKRIVLVRFNDDPMTDSFDFNFGGADIIDWRALEQRSKLLSDLGKWTKNRSVRKASSRRRTAPSEGATDRSRRPSRSDSASPVSPKQLIRFCSKEKLRYAWGELYVGEMIPFEKLSHFREEIESKAPSLPIRNAVPIALCDCTVFGSAKNGFLIADTGIFVSGNWASSGTKSGFLSWAEFLGPDGCVVPKSNDTIILSKKSEFCVDVSACGKPSSIAMAFFSSLKELADSGDATPDLPVDNNPSLTLSDMKKAFSGIVSPRLWIGDSIPDAKRAAAWASMRCGESPRSILVLYDSTVFGGAREGFALTARGLFFKNLMEPPFFIPWCDIHSAAANKARFLLNETLSINSDGDFPETIRQAVASAFLTLADKARDKRSSRDP